ncbi:MAG: hypothetical protein R3C18_24915 [Planctomycetaceae bacterium]
MDQIHVLLEAGADLTLMDGQGRTPLSLAMDLRRKTAEKLLREVGAPEKGRWPFVRPRKTKSLNLQKDFAKVYEYVSKRVRDFDPATHDGLGGPGKVKIVQMGFEFIQAGWVILVLDTRPNAQSDGSWDCELDRSELNMPHWPKASDTNLEESIKLTLVDGSKTVLPANEDLVVVFGDMLKSVLLKAQ